MMRPRTKPPEVRREELLDAAEQLFRDQGIATTGVDDIAAAAGVAKGTFYLHFESKERLLAALRQRFTDLLCSYLQANMDQRGDDDWRGRLHAWIEAGVHGYLDNAALHHLAFHEFRADDPREKHENPIISQLAGLLDQGARAGAWSAEAPQLTAVMLFHALHGLFDDALQPTGKMSRKDISETLEAFFFRALQLKQPALRSRP